MKEAQKTFVEELRYFTGFVTAPILATGMAMDFGTHELRPAGDAIPFMRDHLQNFLNNILPNDDLARLITIHIGNFGWSAIIMTPFAIASEHYRLRSLREDDSSLENMSKWIAWLGIAAVAIVNTVKEFDPITSQTGGDILSGLMGAYLLLHTIQACGDDLTTRQVNKMNIANAITRY